MPTAKAARTPTFFADPADFRRWLEKNHASATEFWVGYNKKASGRGGMTYAQALDEALCFGWIDGVVNTIDRDRYMQRFSPRKPGSIWSNINVRHVARLKAAGKMSAAGLAAFAARDPKKTGIYSFEQKNPKFSAAALQTFQASPKAWKFWEAQPPGYRRLITHWVTSAKQEATRERRLARLIAACIAQRRIE